VRPADLLTAVVATRLAVNNAAGICRWWPNRKDVQSGNHGYTAHQNSPVAPFFGCL